MFVRPAHDRLDDRRVVDDSAHQIVFWPLSPVKDAYLFFQKVE
ncbi:hypothetical protein D8I24_0177 (plasmid) [Cupriavidus necator H850]|nr:hypothetical protein D8I24_0177 [Cupriavidus necator H850]